MRTTTVDPAVIVAAGTVTTMLTLATYHFWGNVRNDSELVKGAMYCVLALLTTVFSWTVISREHVTLEVFQVGALVLFMGALIVMMTAIYHAMHKSALLGAANFMLYFLMLGLSAKAAYYATAGNNDAAENVYRGMSVVLPFVAIGPAVLFAILLIVRFMPRRSRSN